MNQNPADIFRFFNELGIINQLSTSLFSKVLPHGLHISQFSVLNHLVRLGDGKTPLSMANAFQVTKASMTHTLGVLQTKGFISLSPNEKDGRSKLVALTDGGRAAHGECLQAVAPLSQKVFPAFDNIDMGDMLEKLEQVRRFLDENREM